MTTTNQSTETNARGNGKAPKLPTHVAKVRHGYGKKATYERVGVAWTNDDFMDDGHFNAPGAQKFARSIVEDVRRICR